ncbi:YycC family protein [Aneurinibacillus sp. Ricciae_BoGa-3]|uniref:YycC family protein n=1 Tax=Aneurinibacillus sp. Ricciae_BoGa-3 TaxID=3022697 RepID=UPI002341384C|nr:YycC family protein [Aneurinibacillus sp. Ricciae_BoGa-3]WCK53793.1 YycC family protein [Aneurinibacillus sp. Ricciae_BoGa-3]
MRPLQISAETALKLSEKLKLPVEQIMHMPQHILIKKLSEADAAEQQAKSEEK